MRVTVVDPPAYTPPYDHALCEALAARGHEVELATAHFRYADLPRPRGYRRTESFYRRAGTSGVAKAVFRAFIAVSYRAKAGMSVPSRGGPAGAMMDAPRVNGPHYTQTARFG